MRTLGIVLTVVLLGVATISGLHDWGWGWTAFFAFWSGQCWSEAWH